MPLDRFGALSSSNGESGDHRVGAVAPKPLFRDPVYDGAADPVVVWNPTVERWWMFYTNRRANVPGLSGLAWVHGCRIGIAESADGAHWTYLGNADIELPPEIGGAEPTHWAPHIITAAEASSNLIGYFGSEAHRAGKDTSNPIGYSIADGDLAVNATAMGGKAAAVHHMFLTVVPGIFENWQHPRRIVHLTSRDLRKWEYASALPLASDRVIDAAVHPLPGGGWRMWYNNERDRKSIYYADSPDLYTWTDRGKCAGVGERPGEGPYVFRWRDTYWMLVDLWKGLGVYRSADLETWTAQTGDLLGVPGTGPDDGVNGGHPGVVVSGDRAYVFYFTHPGRNGTISPDDKDNLELRRSSIQVVELMERDGVLSCDRNTATRVALAPPAGQ
jgi:hypothetical protein